MTSHEKAHSQPGAKTELVDVEERALEMIKDAIDRDLFASSLRSRPFCSLFLKFPVFMQAADIHPHDV